MEEFHCEVVGENIDDEICATRIQQAETIKADGGEHFSLFKCLRCPKFEELKGKSTEPAEKPELPGATEEEVNAEANDPMCTVCDKPKSAYKGQFIISRQMHLNCYTLEKKAGRIDDTKSIDDEPETNSSDRVEIGDVKPVDLNDPICVVCSLPKSAKKSNFNQSRQMHNYCYIKVEKNGTLDEYEKKQIVHPGPKVSVVTGEHDKHGDPRMHCTKSRPTTEPRIAQSSEAAHESWFMQTKMPVLNIEEPPCKLCRFWIPQQKYIETEQGFMSCGVKLCHAEKQYSDFSCYKIRE